MGVQILADPGIALKAMTQHQATFSHHDLARFLHSRTKGAKQLGQSQFRQDCGRGNRAAPFIACSNRRAPALGHFRLSPPDETMQGVCVESDQIDR
jgi:hypothetical protein